MQEYSENFKRKMVQRMSGPRPISATALSKEIGVAQATLSRWLLAAGTIGAMSKKTPLHEREPARAEERSPEDKLRIVMEAARLSDDELGAFLRREGLHEADLTAWRESMLGALKPATNKHAKSVEARRVRELDHYLTRPDLVFDQADALAALTSVDARDGTTHARGYEERWSHYIANTPSKPPASYLDGVRARFENSMRALEALGA